nr:ferredoxin [Nocardia acidivorans]
MKVIVDRDLCVGNGLCESIAPEVFEVGDDGIASIAPAELSPDGMAMARTAVDSCPSRALRLSP